ncbi:hypothetical protein OB905_11505 [Halobacteria archaeon AArc-dxtr1]|nr:hypothetical protein [Halobacteria archaeon AArc-dxtr1]
MTDSTRSVSRRRTITGTALVATGSIAALAGCGDEGPGEEGEDDGIDHPDEADNETNGGGGGPIDEEDSTGGHPDPTRTGMMRKPTREWRGDTVADRCRTDLDRQGATFRAPNRVHPVW